MATTNEHHQLKVQSTCLITFAKSKLVVWTASSIFAKLWNKKKKIFAVKANFGIFYRKVKRVPIGTHVFSRPVFLPYSQ